MLEVVCDIPAAPDVELVIEEPPEIEGSEEAPPEIVVDVSDMPVYPEYGGALEVTPNDSLQVISTAGKYLSNNITVNPIPKTEYAHITYDQYRNIRIW